MGWPDGADHGTARVIRTDEAGAMLHAAAGTVRATWGGGVLVAMACAPRSRPRPGDLVDYRRWPDGVVTVERLHARERRAG
jgi:hypothetical protein